MVCLRELFPCILLALDQIKCRHSAESRRNAANSQNSILQSEFLVSLTILERISALMLPVTRSMQSITVDIVEALELVDELLRALQDLRSEERFSIIFKEISEMAKTMDLTIEKPRIAKKF